MIDELEQLNKMKNALETFKNCFYKSDECLSLEQHNKIAKFIKKIEEELNDEKEN